jgi:hypothetical protein
VALKKVLVKQETSLCSLLYKWLEIKSRKKKRLLCEHLKQFIIEETAQGTSCVKNIKYLS